MAEIELKGCAPVPLASYLKALGVFRLVAEQKDASARGFWRNETFVLDTALTEEELLRFFLQDYKPSPIISPWNGGSGFFPKDNKLGIEPISNCKASRFSDYVEAINIAKSLLEERRILEKPTDIEKKWIKKELRSHLKDRALLWFDAAVSLSDTGSPNPPLLGSGGNDGRTDFSNNFMSRLTDLFECSSQTGDAKPGTDRCLASALFGHVTNSLSSKKTRKLLAIGQFAPAASGGPNATAGFERETLINPWDYVLMLEGALLFAGSTSRRLESAAQGVLSYPFTVNTTNTDGSNAALIDEKRKSKGKVVGNSFEIWMPLWENPAALQEIRSLLSEGRATLDRRPVRDGLDFARSVASLGVNRGISSFELYAFLQRRGDAISATPKRRIRVEPRPKARLLNDLEIGGWLAGFRQYARKLDGQSRDFVAPRSLQTLALRFDQAIFGLTQNESAEAVQRVLIAVGEAAAYLATSPKARDPKGANLSPPPRLSPRWFIDADDGTPEFRLAAALAGLGRGPKHNERDDIDTGDQEVPNSDEAPEENEESTAATGESPSSEGRSRLPPPFCAHLAPLDEETWYRRRRAWSKTDRLAVWGAGTLERNLIGVIERRLLFATQHNLHGRAFEGCAPADIGSVLAFLEGDTDDAHIAALAQGLAWAKPPNYLKTDKEAARRPLPLAYALLKPFFAPQADLDAIEEVPAGTKLPLPPGLVPRLRANRVGEAVALASRRAVASGLPPIVKPKNLKPEHVAGVNGPRLLASLMIPVRTSDLTRVLRRAYPDLFETRDNPHSEEETHAA